MLTGLAGFAGAQERQSGIQLTPDSARYLISKDVGGQRWAITYNLDDKTVTGNVFPLDGGPPQFLWCNQTGQTLDPNPANSQFTFQCSIAAPCAQAPCVNAWAPITDPVTVPGSFLFPPGTQSAFSGNVQPIFNVNCATSVACHVAGGAGPVNLSQGAAYNNIVFVTSSDPSKFYVDPFDPAASFLMNRVDGTVQPQMPLSLPALPPDQMNAIRNWILEGAANN
jgi:hypothetical protein